MVFRGVGWGMKWDIIDALLFGALLYMVIGSINMYYSCTWGCYIWVDEVMQQQRVNVCATINGIKKLRNTVIGVNAIDKN